MNLIRDDIEAQEAYLDGTREGRERYYRAQHLKAGLKHVREGRDHTALMPHPDNPSIFITPYAYEYFKGVLPDHLPEDSKVDRIMVVTDTDVRDWNTRDMWAVPPGDAFDDFTKDVFDMDYPHVTYDQVKVAKRIEQASKINRFLDKTFIHGMRYMPTVEFYPGDEFGNKPFAIVVLAATQDIRFHFAEMAGCAMLSNVPDVPDHEVHDALARHEWFHLSVDRHLSETTKEIQGEQILIDGIKTPSLKQAWLDARVIGGFMWPFPGRQNGLPLINPMFQIGAFQEKQMQTVYEWCDRVLREFYQPERLAEIIVSFYSAKEQGVSDVPQDVEEFLERKFWDKGRYGIEGMKTFTEFEAWFKKGDDPKLAERAWRYLTQAHMMHVQVSNGDQLDFYQKLYKLSLDISSSCSDRETVKKEVHTSFQNSFRRLMPEVVNPANDNFVPAIRNVKLPGIHYRMTVY